MIFYNTSTTIKNQGRCTNYITGGEKLGQRGGGYRDRNKENGMNWEETPEFGGVP